MLEISLIESLVSMVLNYFSKPAIVQPFDKFFMDFVYKDDDNKIVGVEVKGSKVNLTNIKRMLENVLKNKMDLDKFYLVTPSEPSVSELGSFSRLTREYKFESNWLSVDAFFNLFGLNVKSKEDIEKLKLASINSKLKDYDDKNIGLMSDANCIQMVKSIDQQKSIIDPADRMIIDLGRQFSYSVLAEIRDKIGWNGVSDYLRLGKRSHEVVVVLSDIKNFSSIVAAAPVDDLNEMMNKYYSESRKLVFRHNGVLDKFIGDAVLAIFNYPKRCPEAFVEAIEFCRELVSLGNSIFSELQSNMDNVIDTGTRIGVSVGDIYTLNIGGENIEVTFISDKINLASCLEKNCQVDGILVSNVFKTNLEKTNYSYFERLPIGEVMINRNDAKGQISDVKAWQIKSVVF